MAAAHAGVLRDGEVRSILATDVVPGDVLVLGEGDAVAADARLVEANALKVAEASLTGESEPVLKDVATLPADTALGDRFAMVFSGTAVTECVEDPGFVRGDAVTSNLWLCLLSSFPDCVVRHDGLRADVVLKG